MSLVIERLKSGPSVCLDDFAAAWAEQEARADYLLVASKKDYLLRELAAAIRGGELQVFDTFRNGPRPFRQDDEAELLAARLRVSPASVNTWLADECLAQLEGLPDAPAAPAEIARLVAEPEPLSVATARGARWTLEAKAELAAYRDAHTMPETSLKFGISEQRIRQLLPSKKARPTPFAGLVHHLK